jgi:hypothetical protein
MPSIDDPAIPLLVTALRAFIFTTCAPGKEERSLADDAPLPVEPVGERLRLLLLLTFIPAVKDALVPEARTPPIAMPGTCVAELPFASPGPLPMPA